MLDIRVIRENPEEVKARLKPRSGDAWKLVDDVLACDEARRNAETEKQALQSERNATSKQIGMLKKKGEDTSSIEARVREIGDRIRELDRVAEENAAQLTSLLMNIPNLPHLECPVGADETANPEIKLWGEKPAIENPKDHVELAANLGMISFEDGARITGSGFVVYRGAGARLERALINFLLNTQTVENGYQEVGVPFVVKRECMEGTGQLPKFEEDMYGTEDQQMFLIPTAEVPVTNLYRDTILQESDLPIKMAAYTPCFRLADPTIFLDKYARFADFRAALPGAPRRILLRENFRSRRAVLEGANHVFSNIMSRALGELDYDDAARLRAGAPYPDDGEKPELAVLELPDADDDAPTPDRKSVV